MTISLDCNDMYSKCQCECSQCYEIIVPRTSVSYDGNSSLPYNLSWGAGYCGQDTNIVCSLRKDFCRNDGCWNRYSLVIHTSGMCAFFEWAVRLLKEPFALELL
ncbi:hypothetical protein L208DRAFT_1404190 [Tricholoma matsutake]|nr:hypothetical protein L208DRAFT_1404190 [Tricholoma matsutake 945]